MGTRGEARHNEDLSRADLLLLTNGTGSIKSKNLATVN